MMFDSPWNRSFELNLLNSLELVGEKALENPSSPSLQNIDPGGGENPARV